MAQTNNFSIIGSNLTSPIPFQIRIVPMINFIENQEPILKDEITKTNSSSLPPSIIATIASVAFIIIVILAAITVRRYRQFNSSKSKRDCEFAYDEQEPLKPVNTVKGLDLEMQIVQESDKLNSRIEQSSIKDEKFEKINILINHEPFGQQNPSRSETAMNQENSASVERPKPLKFLAASVAFQHSTVTAVKRLPYTPDPDCSLCDLDDSLPPVERESEDRLTPLTQPKFPKKKMKPRGLLERRGSNVALTITLKSSEKANAENGIAINTKSPKPLAYLQKASCPLLPEELHSKSCDTLKLQQEFWEIPMNHPSEKDFNIPGHGTKNRYRTILPNDHSRVKLYERDEGVLSCYINANYIRDCAEITTPDADDAYEKKACSPVNRDNAAFIATQGPMANTIDDFWRMLWMDECATVVMITKLKERKEKCAQYLPFDVGEEETYAADIVVRVAAMKKYENFTVRQLDVSRGKEKRTIRHFWYTTWMDHETPEKTRGLLELVQEVSLWNKPNHGPVVVHCSAGIGRTGCYIAVTFGCQQLMQTGKADILRLVSRMRLDRGGMIQTWEQYQFVHQALSRYGRILAGENVTTPSTAGSIRSPPDRSARATLNPDLARPSSVRHRRSQSDTNVPSPKEMKLNFKYPAVAPADSDSLTSGRSDFPKICPSSFSPISQSSNESFSKSEVFNSPTSPSIHSPLARMCLQAKDLNVTQPAPGKQMHFDKKFKPSEEGGATKTKSLSQINGSPKNGLTFQLPPPRASPKSHSTTSKKPPLFSFDLPAPASLQGGVESESPVLPNSNDRNYSGNDESNSSQSRFFFPGAADR